ncbi:MAG: EI24 domain-containing protein [Myxococcota bacterium]
MAERATPGLMTGLRAAGRGFRTVLGTPAVRKTYLQLVGALFLLAASINVAGIWAVLHFTPIHGNEGWWVLAGMWLLRIAGVLIVLFMAPVLSLFVTNTLFPLLGERVFVAGVRAVDPARADQLAALEGLPLRVSIPQNLIRLLLFLGLTLGAFALSFVPVVGPVLGPVAQAYVTARSLGWELLDPYFEKLEVRFDAQHVFVKQHRRPLVGFALPFSLAMSIPLVGPLLFGVAQASIGTLVVDVLERPSDATA